MRNDLIRVLQRCACAALLLLLAQTSKAQYTNGIYAEFNTSMGNYTCRLEYVLAPKACANFIGLATGTRTWLDETTGFVKTNALYNGVIFHRVISNFMNQAGSPTGIGTGGPGFTFTDEFSPSLRHDGFGVLSMANSGPDSNGSQFFITVTPQPQLNDVHTVFGKIYGGSNVVFAINRVATDASDRPITNIVINSISVRRIGTSAQSFDIQTNGLAITTNLNVSIARSGTNANLTFSNKLFADNRLYASTTLTNWTGTKLGIDTGNPIQTGVTVFTTQPRQFYRMAQVQYPSDLFVPRNVLNKTLTLNFAAGRGTFVITFNNSGGGSYTWSGGTSGPVNLYTWIQDPYRGRLRPIWLQNFSYIMELHLDYDTLTSGTFKGTAFVDFLYPNPAGSFPVSGTFTSVP